MFTSSLKKVEQVKCKKVTKDRNKHFISGSTNFRFLDKQICSEYFFKMLKWELDILWTLLLPIKLLLFAY